VEAALLKTVALPNVLPHLQAVTDAAKEREDKQAALLCEQLGNYL
jgi:hypothetical protein